MLLKSRLCELDKLFKTFFRFRSLFLPSLTPCRVYCTAPIIKIGMVDWDLCCRSLVRWSWQGAYTPLETRSSITTALLLKMPGKPCTHMAVVFPVLFHTVWNFLTILKITCKEENLFPSYSWQRRTRPASRHRWEDHCGPLFLVQWVHWCYPPRRSQFRPVSGVHNCREAMREPQGGYKKNFFQVSVLFSELL